MFLSVGPLVNKATVIFPASSFTVYLSFWNLTTTAIETRKDQLSNALQQTAIFILYAQLVIGYLLCTDVDESQSIESINDNNIIYGSICNGCEYD